MADTFRQRLQQTVNRVLSRVGLHVTRRTHVFDMDGLLARTATRHAIGTWIDVGASDGSWSLRARRYFPQAEFLLFEPLRERQSALDALRRKYDFRIVAAAAGAVAGQIEFAVDPNLDGSGIAGPGAHATRSVPVETIADAVTRHDLRGPFGIKLDTHGYEIPILEGARGILDRSELLVIEAYNFQLHATAVRFHELCAWLEARGFRCCDLADPMRRSSDGALWQIDLAFARSGHPMFADNQYAKR